MAAQDDTRLRCLHLASSKGSAEDVSAKDESHKTPLHLASSTGSAETVQPLVKYGVDVNAQDGTWDGSRNTPCIWRHLW